MLMMNQQQARRALGREWRGAAARSLRGMLQPWAIGYRFRPQYRIGAHRADFACPKLRLVVELAGERARDVEVRREQAFRRLGWRVVRYSAHEIVENSDDVRWAVAYECDRRWQMLHRRATWRRLDGGRRPKEVWRSSGNTKLTEALAA